MARSASYFTREWAGYALQMAHRRQRLPEGSPEWSLARYGYAVLPNFVSAETAQGWLRLCERQELYSPVVEGETRSERIRKAPEVIPELRPFFSDPRIVHIARSIIGPRALAFRENVFRKDFVGRTGAFDQYFHNDSWRHRLKFFLYLNDVGSENGPLAVVPGTVHGFWKFWHDLDLYQLQNVGADSLIHDEVSVFVGSLLPHQSYKLFRRLGVSPVTVTGKAGTLVVFDARALHRGEVLKAGSRTVLESYWIEEGKHAQ